jgi:glycosyltransferase involved in cell wall biosynthesis
LQSYSVSKSLKFRTKELDDYDLVLIDWTIGGLIPKLSNKIILVDRGPPADKGILSYIQWLVWKKSWNRASMGTVVSEAHREFVLERTRSSADSIAVIPAGVDLGLFQSGKKDGPIKLAYHGRVDVHRGVMSLPMILAGLHSQGVEATLHIHGTGDAVERLKSMELEGLEVTETIPQEDLAEKLATYDVGLLPMPENKVWSLASPLKRSEYLACGMVVCGIDHAGHQIGASGDWLQLYTQKEFITSTISWIKSLDRELLSGLQEESRKFAEENLSWSHSVDALESIILS